MRENLDMTTTYARPSVRLPVRTYRLTGGTQEIGLYKGGDGGIQDVWLAFVLEFFQRKS